MHTYREQAYEFVVQETEVCISSSTYIISRSLEEFILHALSVLSS